MALARIRTHFPEEVSALREVLLEAGYVVETVRPGEFRVVPADLELTVDKLPVVEAWRRIPDAEEVFVAPDTPESLDIRSARGLEISREPLFARFVVETGERYADFTAWLSRQVRELRARVHDFRQQWTPPHEYHAPPHLEPTVPSNLNETRIDAAIEHARLEVVSRNEEIRRKQEAERQRQAEQARLLEQNRQRAREVAEARALLEEQKKIEAMVRASEELRQRVLQANLPPVREVERRRPRRRILRTRRDRAFFRAGVAAFALSMGLAVLAGEALHPQPASSAIPQQQAARSGSVPFATSPSGVDARKLPNPTPGFESTPAALVLPSNDVAVKAPDGKTSNMRRVSEGMIAEDEVIVRKPVRRPPEKHKDSIAHYSDLD